MKKQEGTKEHLIEWLLKLLKERWSNTTPIGQDAHFYRKIVAYINDGKEV